MVVYKDSGKIVADQLKKLVSQKANNDDIETSDMNISVTIIAMDEAAFMSNNPITPFNDPILFVDKVKGSQDIKPIAKPKNYGYGVICGFAGPQAVLTVNQKKVAKKTDYEAFLKELNAMTFQQVSTVPRGLNGIIDTVKHGYLGYKKRKEDLQKQQLIYGATKFYKEDLYDFLKSYGQ